MRLVLLFSPIVVLLLGITPTIAFILVQLVGISQLMILRSLMITLYSILFIVILLTLLRSVTSPSSRIQQVWYYVLGICVVCSSISIIYWILYSIAWWFGISELMVGVQSMVVYGSSSVFLIYSAIVNYQQPLSTAYLQFTSPYLVADKPVKIVYIADIQYGSTTKSHMHTVFEKALTHNPEAILFGGDLVDFDRYQSSDFDFFNNISIPVYFIDGNHEHHHNQAKLHGILQNYSCIRILHNQKIILHSGIEIVGLEYDACIDTINSDLNLYVSQDRFSICLSHEPIYVEKVAKMGFDLSLYGHVHGGQIFPGNIIAWLFYGKYYRGLHKVIEGAWSYTTTGAGLWGPRMRLGSVNEIVSITIMPI